tara:strand:+ start:3200 stop:4564 length:1365 start_codon:yes stop_codon:yes gene_type:complete
MKKQIVTVVGLGFVGFPTACILASSKNKNSQRKFEVSGVDRKLNEIKKKLTNLNSESGILTEDQNLNRIIKNVVKNNLINFSNNLQNISKSDIIIVSVNFDFSNNSNLKNFSELKYLFKEIGQKIKKKSMILMETTIPPGTCDNIIIPILKRTLKRRKIKIEDIYLNYSYERVMPGKEYMNSIINNYRCYAGMNKSSALKCKNFLKQFINYKKFPLFEFDNLIDCEAAKILENSYRAINIAFIDEWTKYANTTKLNLNRVINAIKKRKTHNNIMRPGLGVGGYCITKDPDFINFSAKFFSSARLSFPITNIAKKINEAMPNTSINFIKSKIKNIKKRNVLILGAAYKQDVSDIRYSPTVNLINYFKRKKIDFSVHDPVIDVEDAKKFSIVKKLPNLNNFDLILFCVGHSYYKNIKIKKLPKKAIYFDLNQVLSFSQIKLIKKRKLKLEVLGGNY